MSKADRSSAWGAASLLPAASLLLAGASARAQGVPPAPPPRAAPPLTAASTSASASASAPMPPPAPTPGAANAAAPVMSAPPAAAAAPAGPPSPNAAPAGPPATAGTPAGPPGQAAAGAGSPVVARGARRAGVRETVGEAEERELLIDAPRPFTKAELSLGALTLPRARFSLPTEESTDRADLTLLLTLRQLFQWNPNFAVGAAIDWGLRPTSDEITTETSRGPIKRSHTRNYLMVTGLVRYIPVVRPNYEIWVAASGGALVVNDRYVSELDKAAIPVVVGPQATSVRAEGGTVGLGIGFEYRLDRSWALGGFTQQMLWFLPEQKRCAQTLECASVGGRLFSFEVGLTATYRLRL
jgi:hypothetical protein